MDSAESLPDKNGVLTLCDGNIERGLHKLVHSGDCGRVKHLYLDGACTYTVPRYVRELANLQTLTCSITRLWTISADDVPARILGIDVSGCRNIDASALIGSMHTLKHLSSLLVSDDSNEWGCIEMVHPNKCADPYYAPYNIRHMCNPAQYHLYTCKNYHTDD